MAKEHFYILPALAKQMADLGLRMMLARKRRGLTIIQMAERVGLSRITYNKIESGDPAVSMGNYFKALKVLGLQDGIDHLAKQDDLGRDIQDGSLMKPKSTQKRLR